MSGYEVCILETIVDEPGALYQRCGVSAWIECSDLIRSLAVARQVAKEKSQADGSRGFPAALVGIWDTEQEGFIEYWVGRTQIEITFGE